MTYIKQLMKYMKSIDCKNGILVCDKKRFPKRKNERYIYKEDLFIQILSEEDLRGRSIKINK